MAVATQYKPMRSKVVKNKIPVEIIRCVDNDGKYVLVKKYECGMSRRRRRLYVTPDVTYEQEPCKLDMPAKFKLDMFAAVKIGTSGISGTKPNDNYTVQMIRYCIEKQNTNEYELRNLVMIYLKCMRKEMDKDKFKEVCNIFDKADKMLMRCDRRKNSNINEANVSYKFLIKSYSRIVELCEVKKKVADKPNAKLTVEEAYSKLAEQMITGKIIISGAPINSIFTTQWQQFGKGAKIV